MHFVFFRCLLRDGEDMEYECISHVPEPVQICFLFLWDLGLNSVPENFPYFSTLNGRSTNRLLSLLVSDLFMFAEVSLGSLADFVCSRIFVSAFLSSPHFVSSQCTSFLDMFSVINHGRTRSLPRG